MSTTIAQRRLFRSIDRKFPLRVERPNAAPEGQFVPPMVIQGRTLGVPDPAKTPRQNRREYFEAMQAWMDAGCKPHPVFAPAAWKEVAYDEITHLRLPTALLSEDPRICFQCKLEIPSYKIHCPRCHA